MAHDYLNPHHAPCEGCSPQHTSPEKEEHLREAMEETGMSDSPQNRALVEKTMNKFYPEPSYTDQVVEEFMEMVRAGVFDDVKNRRADEKAIETFLREKLEKAELAYLRKLEAAIVHHQKAGKTAERQRIREIVEGMIYIFSREKEDYLPEVYKHLKSKNEALTDLLSRLDEGNTTENA